MKRVLLLVVPALLCAACVPRSGPAADPPPPARRFILKETPSAEPPATFQGGFVHNACAVLTHEVLAAAGMVLKDGFLQGGQRLSTTDGDRPDLAGTGLWASTCGGVTVSGASVNLKVLHSRFSRRMDWRDAVLKVGTHREGDDVRVSLQTDYNILELGITGFTKLPDPEAALATLLDGIRRNIAQGPRSMPVHTYPAPYDLVADPCAAFPAEVFTTITERPTDGLQQDLFSLSETPGSKYNSVEMRCDRTGLVALSEGIAPNVTVSQTVLSVPHPDAAIAAVREQCDFERGEALARPVGEASCAHRRADGGQVLFQRGRSMVRISLVAAKTDPATTRENLAKGAEAVYARLTPSP
ncbi:hypothetical protein [Amycolatopsis keratiniphila]|uniref:DUF3558 domain-containing protein n=1 Tax=Amycolatopsis keratiniphila subsp. keratiniphila TaxID=227715 RepID=A0A1W2LJK4_9PSEU|nr:hypothetical protein [Amycolatopsis keratiniphila]ONF62922.1 hypothetical protein AVR91_0236360 [Amycolatopsis keratiniphila subsp. keratiniphila]